MSYSRILLQSFLVMFLFYSCAHQVAPTGGEEDKIPPRVVEVYPPGGTVNFEEDFIEITFSEYVQKTSVREAVFISPKIKGELEYSWTGKSLEIEFEDILKENTTYTVTIGTDVQDYNNRNKMAEAYTLVFSTGNEIDVGQISGRVYDEKPGGVLIYAYREIDTLVNPMQQEPDYISQVGNNGRYLFNGLGEGRYLVIAVRDDFRNYLYNVGEDDYGAPSNKIVLTGADSIFAGLDFRLTKEDTVPPNILSATMTDEAHLLIEFSEFIDSTKLNSNNVFIYDSTSNTKHELKYFYKGTAKPKNIFATIPDSLVTGNNNYLVCSDLTDLSGNSSDVQITTFAVNENPDTVEAQLKRTITEFDNREMDHENAYAELMFNDGFNTSDLENAFKLVHEEKSLPIKVIPVDNSKVRIKSLSKLKGNKEYSLEIDLSMLADTKGNKVDSVYTLELKTKNKLDYSGVSGKVSNINKRQAVVSLEGVDGKMRIYQTIADSSGVFNFKKTVPGRYVIWSFLDENEDSSFNYGAVYPYKSSERFVFYPDTLELKARWPVGDVEIDF